MELFEKRVKSRFGYNIISLSVPSFEEFKSRQSHHESNEEELNQRYTVSTDPRLALLLDTSKQDDLCVAETLVLSCVIKVRSQSTAFNFTPQAVFNEYMHTVKPQLEAMSMLRPLTLGQLCRVLL